MPSLEPFRASYDERPFPYLQQKIHRWLAVVRSNLPTMLVVIATALNVHCLGPSPGWSGTAKPPAAKPAEAEPASELPANVAEMREMILSAVRSGRIEELRLAIEWNEMPPVFGDEAGSDPIAFWKKTSAGGEGREVLAVLADILSMAPARLPIWQDAENNAVYVWPYVAERPLDKLKPGEEVDVLRLMTGPELADMRKAGKWTWWRLSIGADGTWLTFMKHR